MLVAAAPQIKKAMPESGIQVTHPCYRRGNSYSDFI